MTIIIYNFVHIYKVQAHSIRNKIHMIFYKKISSKLVSYGREFVTLK